MRRSTVEVDMEKVSMQKRRIDKMQSSWFGGIIMLIMVVGLGVWIWKMMREGKEK